MSGFDQDSYDLGICQLKPPTKDEALKLANELSLIDPLKTLGTAIEPTAAHFAGKSDNACRMAIFVGDALSGIICVKTNWLVGPYVDFVGLLPTAQGQGIGKSVFNWLEEEAVKSKARNLFLCVSDFNHGAIAFYQKLGFKECAQLDALIVDNHGELLMRKRLS